MWRDFLPKIRSWPESLYQTPDNPNQLDGSKTENKLSLEFAVPNSDSQSERRSLRRFGFSIIILSLAIIAALNLFPAADYLAVSYATLFVALGVCGYLMLCAPRFPIWMRFPVAISLSYLLYYYLYFPPQPGLLLAVAVLLAFGFADTVASHTYRIRLTELSDSKRVEQLRLLWGRRFNPFSPQAKGLEFYWVLFPTALAAAYTWRICISPDHKLMIRLQIPKAFLIAAALPLGLCLLAGPFRAVLRGQKLGVSWQTLREAIRATRYWLTYNSQQLRTPGLAQTSIKSPLNRRLLIASLVLVTVATSTAHFHWGLARTRQAMFGEALELNLPASMKWLLPDGHSEWLAKEQLDNELRADGVNLDEMIDRSILYSEIKALNNEGLVEVEGILVEPRQAKILERLTGDTRTNYLERMKQAQAKRERDALFQAEDELWRITEERAVAKTENWAYIPLYYLWLLARPASHVLLVLGFALLIIVSMQVSVVSQPLMSLALLGVDPASKKTAKSLSSQDWKHAVEQMQSSRDHVEKDSIFLGVNASDRSPIIVPRSVFQEHMHLLGDSGSGKTSLGVAPLVEQLIASGDCSVVLLDMKGDDHSLLEAARIGAAKAHLPFRWFTNQLGSPTYLLNPLQQEFLRNLTLYQRADIIASSLGLHYGTDYGRSYFGDANTALLHAAFEYKPDIGSFVELLDVIHSPKAFHKVPRNIRQAASHLGTIVRRLADWEPLNATFDGHYPKAALNSAIDLSDVFRKPQVVSFHIASALGVTSSAEMGRLALYSLMSGAKAAGTNRKQVFLVIDEFQRIVSNNVELLLQTARSMNIGVILANQTLMDLKSGGVDLVPAVRANTRIKQVFAASDLAEQLEISATSGETIYHSTSFQSYLSLIGLTMAGRIVGRREEISPRLRPNEILAMTDHPQRSVVHIRRGDGYAQYAGLPFVMESAFHITPKEYSKRRDAKWPERGDEVITPRLELPGKDRLESTPDGDNQDQLTEPQHSKSRSKKKSDPKSTPPPEPKVDEQQLAMDLLSGLSDKHKAKHQKRNSPKDSTDEQ